MGVPVSGAMDARAHRIANALVGNDRSFATLEITLIGPELEFDDARTIAVCGCEFALAADGRPIPTNAAVQLSAGTRLKFGARGTGARAYLAIAGGIDVPVVLGSRSTHLPAGMGGFLGRAVAVGDRVPLGPTTATPLSAAHFDGRFDEPFDGRFANSSALRVLEGPQAENFADDALDVLLSEPYSVSTDSNRMGFRLVGVPLRLRGSADRLSDATPLGALQVLPSGQPVLLMADRPTTGGYPKVGTVITADMSRAAQLAPGDTVRFSRCSHSDAVRALAQVEREILEIEQGR
jgi:antagonist of KipI